VSNFSDNRARRLRARHLLLLGLLLLVPIVLAPAGSAKPPASMLFDLCVQNATSGTPAPACSSTGTDSNFEGNTVATVQVTLTNDRNSNVSIGSASLAVPPQLKVVASSGTPSSNVSTSSGQTVTIHDIGLNKGQSFVATFKVDVACSGTVDWGSGAQAFNSSNGSGTSFSIVAGSSSGLSSTITTACHLAFVDEPTDTQTGQKIADAGASQGGPVTVGIFKNNGDSLGSCPVGYEAGCSVNVASLPGGVTGTTTQQVGSGALASFDDLSITNSAVAAQYNLTATGVDGFAPTVESSSFLIAQAVNSLNCTGNSCSSQGQKKVSGANLADSFVEVSSSSGFDFMTLSPYTLGSTPPSGCTGEIPLPVAGFAESDGRQPGSGTLTIKYFVNKDILSARYGKNVGNQFTPICVGARRVDTGTGQVEDCTQTDPVGGSTHGWQGDAISAAGKFTGKVANAVCNADGYYWGIISSYQDKLDATQNPVVTNWTGQNIDGNNYREFDMSVPPGWDYRGGP
jgi:hypothetical protein